MIPSDDPSAKDCQAVCHLRRRLGLFLTCGVIGLTLIACTSSSTKLISTENDKLRAANMQLHREIQKLHGSVKAKADQLQALESSTTPPADPDADIPRLSYIEFGRYSTAIDDNGDGYDDLVRLYLLTLDHQKRFIPVAGKAVVQVDHLVPGQKPVQLAVEIFDPQTFDHAYRSGLTGSHYTLDIALPKGDVMKNVTSLTVSLSLTDVQYGKTFTRQIVLPVVP